MMENKNNILLGKTPVISTFAPVAHSFAANEKGTKEMLTDGATGDATNWYGGEWAHFYRGVGRRITFDLGGEYAVNGFEAGFIQGREAGIYCPEEVRLLLSGDGETFFLAARIKAPYPASFAKTVRAPYKAAFGTPVRARYAAVEFEVEVNSFCDEIRLFECADAAEAAPCESLEPYSGLTDANAYAPRESLGGVYDMPLMYFGYCPENERIAKPRREDLLPYVAYLGRGGEILDTMFDSMLFIILQGRCPSGGCLSPHGEPSVYSDWEYITDVLFEKDVCLHALDEAVAETKKALSLPEDYRFTVYLNAPTPKPSFAPFGDINGDGIEEKLLDDGDCVRAYGAYIDSVTRRFAASGLRNIKIGGWFWTNEHLSRALRDSEADFAAACVKAVHDRGYKCLMIPYFCAGGVEKAQKAGFDCVTMQPNLSFNETLQRDPAGALCDFTAFCKKFGFGAELEIHHAAANSNDADQAKKYRKLFIEYLKAFVENGMMTGTVHTYYQAAGPGVFAACARSDDDGLRGIYDMLHEFIKGSLSFDAAPAEEEPAGEGPAAQEEPAQEEAHEEPAEEVTTEPEKEVPAEAAEEITAGTQDETPEEVPAIPEEEVPAIPEEEAAAETEEETVQETPEAETEEAHEEPAEEITTEPEKEVPAEPAEDITAETQYETPEEVPAIPEEEAAAETEEETVQETPEAETEEAHEEPAEEIPAKHEEEVPAEPAEEITAETQYETPEAEAQATAEAEKGMPRPAERSGAQPPEAGTLRAEKLRIGAALAAAAAAALALAGALGRKKKRT